MAARCFHDNCQISWDEVVGDFGPEYEATLNIDADSSLFCDEPSGGLNVKVAPLTVNGNMLQRLPNGDLFAALPLAVHVAQGSTLFAAIPSGADSAAPADGTLDLTYNNTSGLEQLVIFRGQFQMHYDVLRESSPVPESGDLMRAGNISTNDPVGFVPSRNLIPFNAQWIMRLRRGLNGGPDVPVIADHFSSSGLAPDNVTENTYKSEWRNVVWIEEVSNGGSIQFKGDIFHDGPAQTLNIATSPAQQLDVNNANAPARGFRISNIDIYALPIRVA